ncbi:MAG: UbiA family prenyltransferase [archaeon]
MGKRKWINFYNLLKATRTERAMIPFSFIMIAVGFADFINLEVIILSICCVLLYASGGILNAKVDGDFEVRYVSVFASILILTSVVLSFYNFIIFLSVLGWIFLSFIYNKYSRKILFGDSVMLSLTHVGLPIFSACFLLDFHLDFTLKLTTFMFASFLFLVPIKNLNGAEKDIEKGYKTLMTLFKDGKTITYVLFNIYVILMFLSYFIFDLDEKFLIMFAFILMLKIFMDYCLYNGREVLTYRCARLVIILFSFSFVFVNASNLKIIFMSFTLVALGIFWLVAGKTPEVKQEV